MNEELLKRVIVAIDLPDFEKAKCVVDEIDRTFEYIKIGMQAYFGYGDKIIDYAHEKGLKVFLDLKLCDIPNTVSSAIRSLSRHRFELFTVHISGGEKMLKEAIKTLKEVLPNAGIVGVSVLTSLDSNDLDSIGYKPDVRYVIERMCDLALKCGLYGIVCSARDLYFVKPLIKDRLKIITPGIRFSDGGLQDQKRVETPLGAFKSGADFIVMGRPIISGDVGENIRSLKEHLLVADQ